MTSIERLIVSLESDPWAAIYRGAIGFVLTPLLRFLSGSEDSIFIAAAFFLSVLVAMRVVPAVLRRILPFSSEAQNTWAARRMLSKQYDSYALQKLFWIGMGLVLFALSDGGGPRNSEWAIMLFCLICGGIGVLLWRRVRASEAVELS